MPAETDAEAMKEWVREYFIELNTEKGGTLSEMFQDSVTEALRSFDLTAAKRKRSASAVSALFEPIFQAVAAHPSASPTWARMLADVATEIVGDFNLAADNANEQRKRLRQMASAALRPASPPRSPSPPRRSSRLRPQSTPPGGRAPGDEALERELHDWAARQNLESLADLTGLSWTAVAPSVEGLSLAAQVKIRDLVGEDVKDQGRRSSTRDRGRRAGSKGESDILGLLSRRLASFERHARRARSSSCSRSPSRSSRSASPRPHRRSHSRRRSGRSSASTGNLVQNFSRLLGMAVDPTEALAQAGAGLRELPSWPLTGRARHRMAPEFIPQLYAHHRRAEEWAKDWARSKHQGVGPIGLTMVRYGMMLDHALLYDSHQSKDYNILNSVVVEIIVRDMYGLVAAFENVHSLEDTKDQNKKKSKINWRARDMHDVAAISRESISLPTADKDVGEHARRKRAEAKYLAGAPSP